MKNSILFLFCVCSMLLVSCNSEEAREDYLNVEDATTAELRKAASTICGVSYTLDEDDCIQFTLNSTDCEDCYESVNGPRFLRWEVRDEQGNLVDYFTSQPGSYNCTWNHCMLERDCYSLSVYCRKDKKGTFQIPIVENCYFSISGSVLGDC